MRRVLVLGLLVAAGAMATAAARQQQESREVVVDQLKDNLYVLKGGGGNTAVFVASDGVTVVDTKVPGWGQPILDAIKKVTDKPVTRVINTHTHGDHVSGNVDFPASIDIVTQDNTKANMQKMDVFTKSNGRGLPTRTFTDTMTIGSGPDEIDLYYFGPGHTNGDAWVVFKALRTVHAGDLFAGKGLPLVDTNNGGSVLHYAETLGNAYRGIRDVDTVINGHSDKPSTWDDLKTYQEFNQDFLDWAQKELASGKSPAQAAAEWQLPAKYKTLGYSDRAPSMFGGLEGRLQLLATEMKK
jgi:glyoxylase-like metal-dependent hydrolase (beta-lactamase superfamily II)